MAKHVSAIDERLLVKCSRLLRYLQRDTMRRADPLRHARLPRLKRLAGVVVDDEPSVALVHSRYEPRFELQPADLGQVVQRLQPQGFVVFFCNVVLHKAVAAPRRPDGQVDGCILVVDEMLQPEHRVCCGTTLAWIMELKDDWRPVPVLDGETDLSRQGRQVDGGISITAGLAS